jgi:hypothetical protein
VCHIVLISLVLVLVLVVVVVVGGGGSSSSSSSSRYCCCNASYSLSTNNGVATSLSKRKTVPVTIADQTVKHSLHNYMQ